ncbi:MAG TPA: porin [Gammaproteobacteria bacterium]|nr:porin [Gammaproteobacteria bacterium]
MKFRLRLPLLHCAVLCAAGSFSLPALSADGAMDDLLRVLRDRGAISASEYEVLKDSAAADRERASQAVSEATKDTVKVKTGKSGLKLSSSDGDFKFQLGGRAMIDAAYYDKDSTRLGNGAELRRARLFAKGTVYHDWFYKAQIDFAGNSTSLKDFYLGYSGFDSAKVKVGNFKEPFSLEELTSSKYITFMERGLPNTFSPGRNTGLAVSTRGDKWGAAAGYFFEGIKNDSSPKSQGWGATGRVHFAPLAEKERVVHLGAAVSYRGSDGDNEIRFRERPESHVTSTRLVNTGTISGYDNQTLYGLEAATVYGPFSLQGEYMQASVDVSGAGPDPDFSGWYVYGSYFLTGEHRPYKAGSGTFGRVKPASVVGQGGSGAWEIAARYSSIDLEDSGYTGGEEDNITLGVNWYATPNVRFMANYIHASTAPSSPDAFPGTGDEDVNIFQVRSQIDF